MGFSSINDINVPDQSNSTATVLPAFGMFTGEFRDVSGYSSVSLSCISDAGSQFAGIRLEWSTDGVTPNISPQLFTFDPFATSQDGFTVHATVRSQFYRVLYTNGNVAQTSFVLTTLLRKGTPAGTVHSIDPTNTFTTNIDVQSVQSILSLVGRANPEQIMLPRADDVNLPNDGPFVFVSPRPGKKDNLTRKTTPASLTSVQLSDFERERGVFLSITNNVLRGNLYLSLGGAASLTSFDYKVLPGETWQDPSAFGSVYGGNVFGIWDEAYINSPTQQLGNARYVISYYG